jgi:hypothetical protein
MLGTLMSSVFSEEVAAWQDARRAGASLGDHLVAEQDREGNGREPREGRDAREAAATDAQATTDAQAGTEGDTEVQGRSAAALESLHNPAGDWEDSGVDLPTTVLAPNRAQQLVDPDPLPRRWPLPWPLPRWLWLVAAAVVALCAAGWLVSTVLG